MYLDAQLLFSDAQAFTATAASTNIVDLGPLTGNTARQIADGEPMSLVIQVDVAADFTTGDETYALSLETDDNTSFSSAAVVFSQAILASLLTAGAMISIPLPSTGTYERYIRAKVTTAGTTPTLTATIFLVPTSFVQMYRSYAKNYTIT